ncbi:MAG: Hint domain-containing protein [Pseudomonadota bacterium]
MATIVIYEINRDPLFFQNVRVIESYTVEIVDTDPFLEPFEPGGQRQLDVDDVPGFIGNSSTFQAFEAYTGTVGGQDVAFTLLQFAGRQYMVLSEGSVSVNDVIAGTNNTIIPSPPLEYDTLPDFVCFTAGSLIATPGGLRLIETIRPGDLVTVANGPPRRVRWAGRRRLSPDELSARPHLAPIRIRAGSLGPGLPVRDLCVSPQHRLAMGSWRCELMFAEPVMLVQAQALIDGKGIARDDPGRGADYVHLLFDAHELVEVEGVWSESFFPGAYALASMSAEVRAELFALFPELSEHGTRRYADQALPSLRPYEARAMRRQLAPVGKAVLARHLAAASLRPGKTPFPD